VAADRTRLAASQTLNVLHVLRAPVGGLFRHVIDLARGQTARGHRVGVVADASTGGAHAEVALAALRPHLAYGVSRIMMSRHLGSRDIAARAHVAERAVEIGADVVHGHGAKGGAYVRLLPSPRPVRVYTPHGGSLHYDWRSPAGFLYLAAERAMMQRTDLFLFESHYGRTAFESKVGKPGSLVRVVHNGVAREEFAPIAPDSQQTDVVFIGELRSLKGVDVLFEALAILSAAGKSVTASIVGNGPDRGAFEELTRARGVSARFLGAMPARTAFALGRLLVVPSRAESLPYIVLEAAAAAVPMVATAVGGIPEIYGPDAFVLIPIGDPKALAGAIEAALAAPAATAALALRLQGRVRDVFSVDAMIDAVLAAYREALARQC
jgi:glycosyltransferase involved in cell wall biosynthesis